MRRAGCLALALVLLAAAAALLGLRAVAALIGVVPATGVERVVSALALTLGIAATLLVARAIRRLALPVAALVEAAGRLEGGDLTTRVPERGPPDIRALARAFNQMSARLQATDTERRTFLADVAHELRTPLSVIQARLEALIDGIHPTDTGHLALILAQTRALERLVDDLRTVTLAEAGSLTLAREPVDVAVLLNEAVASLQDGARDAAVTLDAHVAPGVVTVELDPARIRRVVVNLLINAIRHTPAGGSVTIDADTDTDAGAGSLRIRVRDTGRGIDAELLPRIFERFVRGEDSPGSGLGLAISRDIVNAHGGTIEAFSEPGAGTTVTVRVPAR